MDNSKTFSHIVGYYPVYPGTFSVITISDLWRITAFSKNGLRINYDWVPPYCFIYCCLGTCGHGCSVRVSTVDESNSIYYRTIFLFNEGCNYFSYPYLYRFTSDNLYKYHNSAVYSTHIHYIIMSKPYK